MQNKQAYSKNQWPGGKKDGDPLRSHIVMTPSKEETFQSHLEGGFM
jgi:hypothetical protein